jgi:indole-3-glycerol phosphate synthase
MSDILERICQDKRAYVAACRANRSLESLTAAAKDTSPPRGFAARLSAAVEGGRYGLICEIKKASPSKGLICEDFAPAPLASGYEAGGAACLSVLTDVPYFQGSDSDLTDARGAVTLPVLRKDFMVDPYQIVESRALGADCVLLILAALGDAQAKELEDAALGSGLDVLVEVHNATELDRALQLQTQLIGINNRDLKTFEVDLATTERLCERIPKDRTVISESGLGGPDDLARLARAGVNCFLIGEALMRSDNVEAATRFFLMPPKMEGAEA